MLLGIRQRTQNSTWALWHTSSTVETQGIATLSKHCAAFSAEPAPGTCGFIFQFEANLRQRRPQGHGRGGPGGAEGRPDEGVVRSLPGRTSSSSSSSSSGSQQMERNCRLLFEAPIVLSKKTLQRLDARALHKTNPASCPEQRLTCTRGDPRRGPPPCSRQQRRSAEGRRGRAALAHAWKKGIVCRGGSAHPTLSRQPR